MCCMVLGKQGTLCDRSWWEIHDWPISILWYYLFWQLEQNKCFLVKSGFYASVSVLGQVPALFAYLPEKFSDRLKSQTPEYFRTRINAITPATSWQKQWCLRKKPAISYGSAGSAGSETKEISLAGWWYLYVIIHCADICSLLLLFHLTWEGKDGDRNGEWYHRKAFAGIVENIVMFRGWALAEMNTSYSHVQLAAFSRVQQQSASEMSCAFSHLVLGPRLRELFSFSFPSPHLLPLEIQADGRARNRAERGGKRKGEEGRTGEGRTLQSATVTA